MEPKLQSQSIVVFMGPPGAGKGTQAEYLAERFGFFHFETSKIIQGALASHNDNDVIAVSGVAYPYAEERRKFFSGILNTPEVVTFWVNEAVRQLYAQNRDIVFSGSPRTAFEAENLLPVFLELVGNTNCRVLHLDVPYAVSLARNTRRLLCVACRLPHRTGVMAFCRRCGGELKRREGLDDPETIRVRWREFEERTLPVLAIARTLGISVERLDATQEEEEVYKMAREHLGLLGNYDR